MLTDRSSCTHSPHRFSLSFDATGFLLIVGLLATALPGWADDGRSPFAKWGTDISAFEASDKTDPPPKGAIVFVGSSSIRMWKDLAKDFPDRAVINRGFGGSEIIDLTHFADRMVLPYAPRQIVMYAGGNDINARKTPEKVFEDFKAFVRKIHATLPDTRIAYISIAPNPARWSQIESVRRANQMIEEFTRTDRRLDFIDVFPAMLGADGQPKPDIFLADRLHMNERGYAIWREIVSGHLLNIPAVNR